MQENRGNTLVQNEDFLFPHEVGGYSIRKYKEHEHSRGVYISCEVLLHGKKVLDFEQEGRGGMAMFQPYQGTEHKKLIDHVKSLGLKTTNKEINKINNIKEGDALYSHEIDDECFVYELDFIRRNKRYYKETYLPRFNNKEEKPVVVQQIATKDVDFNLDTDDLFD